MSVFKRGKVWWYEFWFAGRRIQEFAKATSKTVAKLAEQSRSAGATWKKGSTTSRTAAMSESERFERLKEYLDGYVLRNRRATFAEYAIGHVTRLLGGAMIVDADETMVLGYQDQRLREKRRLRRRSMRKSGSFSDCWANAVT